MCIEKTISILQGGEIELYLIAPNKDKNIFNSIITIKM